MTMARMRTYVVPGVFVDTGESFTESVDATDPADAEDVVRDRHFPRVVVVSRDLIVAEHAVAVAPEPPRDDDRPV